MGTKSALPHVVIVGGGFGGIAAARALQGAAVKITILDRSNHHTFLPLLYQAATASLSPHQVARPIRSIFRKQKNVEVQLAEVIGIDLKHNTVDTRDFSLNFDYLILSVGTATDFRGHPEWERFAPGLKDLDDALEIRRRLLVAFEHAERETDPQKQRELLTIAIIGGGATGVELAGAIGELVKILVKDFRHIRAEAVSICIIHGGDRIVANYPEALTRQAETELAQMGVTIMTEEWVESIDKFGVSLSSGKRIATKTVIWTAGVRGNPLLKTLASPTNKYGQLVVTEDLSLPEYRHVFAVGDAAEFRQQGKPIPALAPAAIQGGTAAAQAIIADLNGKPRPPFRYIHKGEMVTIGKFSAIARVGRFNLSGAAAWLAWLVVHLTFLNGFRNRIFVLFEWIWAYATEQRSARLITAHRMSAGAPDESISNRSNHN